MTAMRSFWPSGPVKRPYNQSAQNRADVPFKNVTGSFVFPRLLNQPAERSLMLIDLFAEASFDSAGRVRSSLRCISMYSATSS